MGFRCCCFLNCFELFGTLRAEVNGDAFHGVVSKRWDLRRRRPGLRLAFKGLVKSTLKSCELRVFLFERSLSFCFGCSNIYLRRCAPVNPSTHLPEFFASRLPALLTMLTLLNFESLSQTDPEGTSKEAAKDCNDDGVGFGLAVLRVVKAWAAVG